MKAVILAGGEGTRLRPLTCTLPKPMIPLMGRPVMEYMIRRLAEQGIRDIAVTVCYLPDAIRSYFGSGKEFGVNISYYTEQTPLGTAGCIAACADFIDEATLIVSGDGVCDFDFNSAFEKHKNAGAEATLLLTSCRVPLDYGLVVTDGSGRISRFVEKPSWQSVCTDLANTGIYIIEPELTERIPRGKCDFARDIFPVMLKENAPLYGFEAEGYWCDIGDCGAYLDCMRVMLSKYSRGSDPSMAQPVFIERGARVDSTASIGPYVYVGRNAVIEGGAVVSGSSVEGRIGPNARVSGTIVCRGAEIGAGSVTEQGCVIGENAGTGKGSVICGGVRIWSGRSCPDGARVRYSLSDGLPDDSVSVSDGLICAPANAVTPELCLSLGTAAVRYGSRIGGTMEAGSPAEIYLSAFETGVCAGGGNAVNFSVDFAAQAAYAAKRIRLDLCMFFEWSDGLKIYAFDRLGGPLDSGKLRNILSDARRGNFERAAEGNIGRRTRILSIAEDYCRAVNYGSLRGAGFSVSMSGAGKTLCNILWLRGARILSGASGCPVFAVTRGGFGLEACDEDGRSLSDMKTLACAAYIAAERGEDLAVPFGAPTVLGLIAADAGVRLYRMGEDEDAARRMAEMPYLRDGVHRAAYIAAYLCANGLTLKELADRLPAFAEADATVSLRSSRPEFMRAAAELLGPCSFGQGIRARCGGGWAVIVPCADRQAVRIFAESFSDETALELCDGLRERLEGLDSALKRRKSAKTSL